MKYLILLLASLLFLSCSDEINPLLPFGEATLGVKSKMVYPSLESNQVLSIEDFEYNYKYLLVKKFYYSGNREMLYHYEFYNYDDNGKPVYKLNYHSNINSPSGFILLDSTSFLYSNNLRAAEKITYPVADYYEMYRYEYDGKYLIKKSKFRNEDLDSYIVYEYTDGKISIEINYIQDNSIFETKEYKYKGAALEKITYYTFMNEAKRTISYSYNKKGKLILEKVDELFVYSSSLPHIIKYVY